jgi:hypothetical protein
VSTPQIHLETAFVLDSAGRILSTREPQATAGPIFFLVRGSASCAWAVRSDVADDVAEELCLLAQQEPLLSNFHDAPRYAKQYNALIGGRVRSGPAFIFPQSMVRPADVVEVDDEQLLGRHFRGWVAGEIAAGSMPVLAIMDDGYPVSVCFSARRSLVAADAGLETAISFRGRGFGPRVTIAWALAVRASGRTPLYTTDWTNAASLAVARKLSLEPYAANWSLSD